MKINLEFSPPPHAPTQSHVHVEEKTPVVPPVEEPQYVMAVQKVTRAELKEMLNEHEKAEPDGRRPPVVDSKRQSVFSTKKRGR